MLRSIWVLLLLLSNMAFSQVVNDGPIVLIKTNLGDITVALNEKKAPATVGNFMRYVNEGFYTNTIFHRVIPGFMIQGGGYDDSLNAKSTHSPIESESQNGLKNVRGSIAMARSNLPHSATSQFFINLVDNDYLNPGQADQYGYTVFGKVIKGMDVVDDIAKIKTTRQSHFKNLPTKAVIIESAKVVYDPQNPKKSDDQGTEAEAAH